MNHGNSARTNGSVENPESPNPAIPGLERELSNAIEQTADSVIICERDGRIKYVNPAFKWQTGYTRQEALSQPPRLLKSGEHPLSMFVRRVIREFLSSNGHIVLEAGDGAEALHLSERYKGPIHLLLTDVVLPRTCGRELVEHLEPLHPKTKIPYMSGYTNDTIFRHNALEQGAAFLQKSFTLGNLARKVREVLDAREKL